MASPLNSDIDERRQAEIEAMESILSDPSSSQTHRDMARTRLQDPYGLGSRDSDTFLYDSVSEANLNPEMYPPGSKYHKQQTDWLLVEAHELDLTQDVDGDTIVSAAARACLVDDTKIQLRIDNPEDLKTMDARPSYPKLVGYAKAVIRNVDRSNPCWADAHIILSFLARNPAPMDAIDHLKKAIPFRAEDWRLRSGLSSLYAKTDNFSLSLQSCILAEELASDEYDKWTISTSKAKVLLNLGRKADAKAAFEAAFDRYDAFKSHPEMNDRILGHLAVAQYMLCTIYIEEHDGSNARSHFKEAEDKVASIDPKIAKTMNWQVRALCQMMMSSFSPTLISHHECKHCHQTTNQMLRCGRCKAVYYCSKQCQVASWKGGHKAECRAAKEKRSTEKKQRKVSFRNEQNIRQLAPLDATLDPKELWNSAVALSRKGTFPEDAAWMFLVALFMDFSLDGESIEPAKHAMERCDASDPVVLSLGIVVKARGFCGEEAANKILQLCAETCENLREMALHQGKILDLAQRKVESWEMLDRGVFGTAMGFIFYARFLGRIFQVRSMSDAQSREFREAFNSATRLVDEAKQFLDVDRWLTFRFELGYSNFDCGAMEQAKIWLTKFVNGLEALQIQKGGGALNRHWKDYKGVAEQKLFMIPLMEMGGRTGLI